MSTSIRCLLAIGNDEEASDDYGFSCTVVWTI